jgi:glycosyltransferase involved in cell wall biosynthesis
MNEPSVLVTVAICTWNRSHLLDVTLEQFQRLRLPSGCRWELLVVNNNSTDNTEAVVQRYSDSLPVRCVFEKKQGLSHARNCAIEEAKGEVIVWTDDDVRMDQNWLVEYCDGIRRYPDASFFGGPIRPWFEVVPPQWIRRNFNVFKSAFGGRDLSDSEIYLSAKSGFPFGANMAVRKSAYEGVPYDVNLGRIGASMVAGEETMVFEELVRRGCQGVWLPCAGIEHFVPRSKVSRDYVKSYFRGYGQTLIRIAGEAEAVGPRILGAPRWTVRYLVKIYAQWMLMASLRHSQADQVWVSLQTHLGKMIEYRRGIDPLRE